MADEDTYLLVYTYVENMADRRGPYREAHWPGSAPSATPARSAGGRAGHRPTGGAIVLQGVTREDIETFTAADPYVERAGHRPAHRALEPRLTSSERRRANCRHGRPTRSKSREPFARVSSMTRYVVSRRPACAG